MGSKQQLAKKVPKTFLWFKFGSGWCEGINNSLLTSSLINKNKNKDLRLIAQWYGPMRQWLKLTVKGWFGVSGV